MTYIGLGCLCFLFFILYDLNQIHKNHRGIRPLFAVGCITLCVLTITMSVTEFESDYQVTFPAVAVFFGSLSIVGVGFVKIPPQFYEKGPFYV